MSAAFNIKTKHANDVHDELQQLSLEMPSLFHCSILRETLQIISRIYICIIYNMYTRDTCFLCIVYNILDSEITKTIQYSYW